MDGSRRQARAKANKGRPTGKARGPRRAAPKSAHAQAAEGSERIDLGPKRKQRAQIPSAVERRVLRWAFNDCQAPRCAFPPGVLDVHHINENPSDNRVGNLIALCPSHHRMVHQGKIPRWKLRYWNLRSRALYPLRRAFPSLLNPRRRRPVEEALTRASGRHWLLLGVVVFLSLSLLYALVRYVLLPLNPWW
jgi:hypothetical protein